MNATDTWSIMKCGLILLQKRLIEHAKFLSTADGIIRIATRSLPGLSTQERKSEAAYRRTTDPRDMHLARCRFHERPFKVLSVSFPGETHCRNLSLHGLFNRTFRKAAFSLLEVAACCNVCVCSASMACRFPPRGFMHDRI